MIQKEFLTLHNSHSLVGDIKNSLYVYVCVCFCIGSKLKKKIGLFVRLTRAVRCHRTLGNTLIMFTIMDNDIIPPHTVLGHGLLSLSILGPIYLSAPLLPLDKRLARLVTIIFFLFCSHVCVCVVTLSREPSGLWTASYYFVSLSLLRKKMNRPRLAKEFKQV